MEMHQKLISLEGNVIFEKVKRLYKLFCICRARNLQRSWDLSLVNVKALMISAYCRKLEKYRCTQMSLRSRDCIYATIAFFLSPSNSISYIFAAQGGITSKCMPAHYFWETPERMLPTSLHRFLQIILSYLVPKFPNQLLPIYTHTNKTGFCLRAPGLVLLYILSGEH